MTTITLTFDNGPDPDVTPLVLATLRRHGILSTFFVLGDWALPNGWVERALEMCLAKPEALVVLHDLPTGAMSGLERFIGAARDRGATFAQDFPASCIPIERGRLQAPIDLYMTRASG